LGLIIALGAATGFAYLGKSSFWLDETVSTTLADTSWHRFTHVVTTREANMSLYHLLLRAWIHLGHSEVAVRSFSVLAGLGALTLVIFLTRRLFSPRAALICGLLLAVDPLVVEFGQEARGYALSMLLVAASSILFVRGVQTPNARFTWSAYMLASALACYVNFWAALVPVGQAVSLLFLPSGVILWRRYLTAIGSLVILLVPLGLLIHSTDSAGTNWAAGTAAGRLFRQVRDHVPHAVIIVLTVAVLAAATGTVVLLKGRPVWGRLVDNWSLMFTACSVVIPVAALILLSFAYKPLFVLHYLVIFFPPLVMLVAVGLARLKPHVGLVALALFLAVSGVGLWRWYATGPGQDWRGAATYVADQSGPGDGVMIFAPYMRIPFEWYLVQHPQAERDLHAVYPSLGWANDPLRFDYSIPINPTDVARGADGDLPIWLVLSDAQLHPQREHAVLRGLQLAGFAPRGTRDFAGIQVVRYEPIRPQPSVSSTSGTT